MKVNRFVFLWILTLLFSCQEKKTPQDYRSIIFCNEEWMLENLDVSFFRNGDIIPQAISDDEWKQSIKSEKPAWCYPNNDGDLGKIHGKIYNWYAITDSRGLAPKGWKIANDEDWTNLTNCFGGQKDVIKRIEAYLLNSTNYKLEEFFTYGGTRGGHGAFTQINEYGRFFTTTELLEDNRHVWRRAISIYDNHILSFGVNKEDGLYVKCVKVK